MSEDSRQDRMLKAYPWMRHLELSNYIARVCGHDPQTHDQDCTRSHANCRKNGGQRQNAQGYGLCNHNCVEITINLTLERVRTTYSCCIACFCMLASELLHSKTDAYHHFKVRYFTPSPSSSSNGSTSLYSLCRRNAAPREERRRFSAPGAMSGRAAP